ncbi:uncharacterized protein BCR38DRAFT_122554 [Pseudomassariella vexata]|uniref:alpha-galactosidase n=1 Tax=Pseudomassariella vexata TaxID=1141098 RepID=A0A1Y2D914_9PEZI|nr:uncharacterized protein BCR38DRAFT_122554 [Pseudomassariella vexata]ORY55616.1 hypothetical protein BCR38DRAFT_122554 [Pseudomassariella vexata]
MRDVLLHRDRTTEYSLSTWGQVHLEEWSNATGHSWRKWVDIYPQWTGQYEWSWGVMPILNDASCFWDSTNFWSHRDWGLLEISNGEPMLEDSYSHLAFWAAIKSPLVIGTKLEGIKREILEILMNRKLITFN